jgi:hypothetical protein
MGLERRGMELDTRCVMCGRYNEDGGHLFFQCKYVKPVWQELNLNDLRCVLASKQSPRELLQSILDLKEDTQLRVINLIWHWWLERNRVWKGERPRTPTGLAAVIAKLADEFPTIGRKEDRPVPMRQKMWSKPARDEYKVNSDGSFSQNSGDGGWGYVIRDHVGEVIKAGVGKCAHLLDAFHSEVLACKAGVQAAEEMGMPRVVVETDSLLLKLALDSNSFALSQAGGIIHEIKSMLNVSFSSWRSSYCPRECNRVAHAVAAQGCKCPPDTFHSWNGTPPGVEDLVARDCPIPLS